MFFWCWWSRQKAFRGLSWEECSTVCTGPNHTGDLHCFSSEPMHLHLPRTDDSINGSGTGPLVLKPLHWASYASLLFGKGLCLDSFWASPCTHNCASSTSTSPACLPGSRNAPRRRRTETGLASTTKTRFCVEVQAIWGLNMSLQGTWLRQLRVVEPRRSQLAPAGLQHPTHCCARPQAAEPTAQRHPCTKLPSSAGFVFASSTCGCTCQIVVSSN